MEFEISCGGVVFIRQDNGIRYLIIRHLGGHCGFPKGHMEPGESERETALREIREETGLDVSLIGDFRREEFYSLPNKPDVQKKVIYFLAEFTGQQIVIQPEEISACYLLPYEEALEHLPFPEAKRILSQAHDFLKEMGL